MPTTIPAFTADQLSRVQRLLATKVVQMGGRKLEEGDWTDIYCEALGYDNRGWSNLSIDVVHGNVGIEHKLMRAKSKTDIATVCGTSLMHPSLTRSFRLDPNQTTDANEAMQSVFGQYAALVESRKQDVRRLSSLPETATVEIRTGWLLWQDSLRQFLYFEEPATVPDPNDYYAEWKINESRGARKRSVTLWIYEKTAPNRKRYSVTTDAGAKIQPYFDVPSPPDPNLYIFTVIGEEIRTGFVRAWVTERTRGELESLVGVLDCPKLSGLVLDIVNAGLDDLLLREFMRSDEAAVPIELTTEAYTALRETVEAANDELRFRALVVHLRQPPPN